MCGVAGFVDCSRGTPSDVLGAVAMRMADTLAHRGPDDRGTWVDADAGIALGHRRLSIIDLSPLGHQPMVSVSGRYIIAFNGEIYNYRALGRELEGLGDVFRGHSDTEVLLAAFSRWGVIRTLERLNGMFAFALWDRQERLLHLVRDPMGKKPMYYARIGSTFAFGSELKALRECPGFPPSVCRRAVALYLEHGYVPAPHSIYENVYKLQPATVLTVGPIDQGASHKTETYWSLSEAVERGMANPFQGSGADAVQALDEVLRDAVSLRMISDVPLGAFLSGGVDSSVVVALMQAQSGNAVRTFTIAFHEATHSEATEARAVAEQLGTDHTELYVSPRETLAVIPQMPVMFDEPFADSSQIPMFLVSQLARRVVTVSLSGDGGDELFGGYNRYAWGPPFWAAASRAPKVARRVGAAALETLSPRAWDTIVSNAQKFLPKRLRLRHPGDKVYKLAASLRGDTPYAMYTASMAYWPDASAVVLGADGPESPPAIPPGLRDPRLQMMYADTLGYLPDDILVKVDRASMAVGLEARAPLLDRRIVEFAWRLPMSLRIGGGRGKWILRQTLHRYLPKELVDRTKSGFEVPVASWLRNELKDWAEALLGERRLRDDGLLRPEPIRRKWAQHQTGERNCQQGLWGVLMLQAWLDATRT